MELIVDIARRARDISASYGRKLKLLELVMDISAAHESCPMDLRKLVEFDEEHFMHDVFGIRRHLNRESGKLENYFVPRCKYSFSC